MTTTNLDDRFNAPAPKAAKPDRAAILAKLDWSEDLEVQTKRGPRLVRRAFPTPEFYELYRAEKNALYNEGYSLGQNKRTAAWEVCHWREIPAAKKAEREAAKALSRATDAVIDVAAPEGLAYLGYQKAGIAFGSAGYAAQVGATLIGDEMGLGKTIQAIGIINADLAARKILVVCPASLKLNWQRELNKWLTRPIPILVVSSDSKEIAKCLFRSRFLDNEKGPHGVQQELDVAPAADVPTKLIASSPDLKSPVARAGRGLPQVVESSVAGEKRDQVAVRRVDDNDPSALLPTAGNRALAVDDSREVSSRGSASGQEQGLRSTTGAKKARKTSDPKVVVERVGVNAEGSRDGGSGSALGKQSANDAPNDRLSQAKRDGHIFVINYDILHLFQSELHEIEFDILICDEAHYLKSGAKSRRAKMVFGVAPKKNKKIDAEDESSPAIRAKRKVFLTGTPIPNRPKELFPLINYLDPAGWPNFFAFTRRYCAAYNNGFGWDDNGASNLEELQDKLRSTIMIRRLKKDVLTELPAKRRQIIELPPTGAAAKLIRRELELYEGREDEIEELQGAVELAKASDVALDYVDAVGKLRKGMMAIFGALSTIRRELAVAKMQMPEIQEHLADAVENSGKVIVFGHHKEALAVVKAQFGDAAVMIVGDTSMPDRQAAADRFQTDPTCKVIIGSFGAMGVGWTLVASAHVVFIEEDWVPGVMSQGEDRAHRIGQKESVLVQHLILEGSLDVTMAKRTVSKQNVIDSALDKVAAAREVVEEAPTGRKREPAASADSTPSDLAKQAELLTSDQCAAAEEALRFLAARCDGAKDRDGAGFSGLDTRIGKDLAARPVLSKKQAALATKIVRKYGKQLPEAIKARLAPR